MNSTRNETKLTLLYIAVAFAFSVAMRMIWIYQFNAYEPFHFNGQLMINTNDGYFWAEGARDLLSGISQPNDLSPTKEAAAQLTAMFASVVPFSFESVILYMPVFLSSLIVIPIILIAKNLKNLEMGFIAALLASIAWSYYNRTMAGYYDTDMLNIVLPMFLLWSIIWAIQTHKNIYLLITAIDILVYRWWYPSSYSLEFSFIGLILAYTLIFDRKNSYNYKLLAIMIATMVGLDGAIRFALVLGLFFLFVQEKYDKYIYYIFGATLVAFLATGGFDPIWVRLKAYIFNASVEADKEGLGLYFFTVKQTIREAGNIPFETFANRISGHPITFVLSLVGYLYLSYKHRIMLLGLPMIGLGFLASVGGLRFTIYAVPLLAFGIAFLITELASRMPTQKLKIVLLTLLTLAILYPNYKHIDGYKVPTVFNADEVKVVADLGKVAQREDYVVSWWDYGYPLRYYADVKTLVDGGKHEGSANFPVSFMLTHTQEEAAKMARLDVEYTEKLFEENSTLSEIETMSLDYGFKDTNDFLLSLQTDIKLPKKTRDVYFYLPYKMINIYPTVTLFSNLNLMNGVQGEKPFFFVSRSFKDLGAKIELAANVYIDKQSLTLEIGNKKEPLRRFVKTLYDKSMKLHLNEIPSNLSARLSVIYMSNYNTFLVVDEKTYNSLYIQLMVLQKSDPRYFEAVILNPNAKVYKLKI